MSDDNTTNLWLDCICCLWVVMGNLAIQGKPRTTQEVEMMLAVIAQDLCPDHFDLVLKALLATRLAAAVVTEAMMKKEQAHEGEPVS